MVTDKLKQIDDELSLLTQKPFKTPVDWLNLTALQHLKESVEGEQLDDGNIVQGMAFRTKEGYLRIFECWSVYPNGYGEIVGLFTAPQKYNDQVAEREHLSTLTRSKEDDLEFVRNTRPQSKTLMKWMEE